MPKLHVFILSILLFICACKSDSENASSLSDQELKRVVLLGGTLMSSMENHAFFESAILRQFPDKEISFRNIAWPADDVFGLARSQFGSAQNTRSWQPPSAEEGFGSKVLMRHIEEAQPTTMIVGYGSEAAFFNDEDDFTLFESGYKRLIDFAESEGVHLILVSPPKQEVNAFGDAAALLTKKRNSWLLKARDFIRDEAEARQHQFVDLYDTLVADPTTKKFTTNGIQLNAEGYEKMSSILLDEFKMNKDSHFKINIDDDLSIQDCINCESSNWEKTLYGVRFNLAPKPLHHIGDIHSPQPVAVYVNGKLLDKNQDTLRTISLEQDSLVFNRFIHTIKEKNRLHRYRLRPLNEAYIYLFRRHEMGHLAYEMDDLHKLIEEKEVEIKNMVQQQQYYVELETIQPWQSPKDYPEDEVPANIPEPNIQDELNAFTIADGFEMNLFAADPMIANPININWDTRGRAWVATSSTYPHIVPGREPNDKIIILEDTDGDGVADKHTVFADNLLVPHSVLPIKGGAIVAATTELLLLLDHDGDDVADERRVLFDGFGNADIHHTIHGLRWTPWGDIHFTQSIYINSFVETAHGPKVLNGSGIWSFRPETEELSIFCRGLVNPWGEAFDEWGQAFATDGAGGSGINYVFPESAHATAVGASKVLNGLNSGTPKNTSAEVIYSQHFPRKWQGSIITNDYRANRTVRYEIERDKSGYRSEEIQTVLKSDHRSYRPVDSKIGPDGALYIVDWYNPIIDHGEVDFHHPIRDKTHGRIWRLTNKHKESLTYPMASETNGDTQLELLKSPQQFTRLQANRAFVNSGANLELILRWLRTLNQNDPHFERTQLEALWLLTALNYYDASTLKKVLRSSKPQARAAGVRMLAHWKKQKELFSILEFMIHDKDPQVRLEVLHALREMNSREAVELAMNVRQYPLDDNLEFASWLTTKHLKEHWLPAFESGQDLFKGNANNQMFALLSTEDPEASPFIEDLLDRNNGLKEEVVAEGWAALARNGSLNAKQKVLQKVIDDDNLKLLDALVNSVKDDDEIPENTSQIEKLLSHKDKQFRLGGIKLVGQWKLTEFLDNTLQILNSTEDQSEQLAVLESLVLLNKLDDVKQMAKSNDKESVRVAACVVWIQEEPGAAADHAVTLLADVDSISHAELIFIAFKRKDEGPKVLEAALEGKILREEIASVGLKMVQTSGLNLKDLEIAIRKAGSIKAIGTEMTAQQKEDLIADALESGSLGHGRQIYRRQELLCATCHKNNNIGGLAGPDLTTLGTYMTPNSILESLINPNKDIKQGYETIIVTKTNGEILSGLLHRKTDVATLVRSANGDIITVPNAELESIDVSPMSLMPSGLVANLHRDELKDLLAYLTQLGK